MKTLKETNNEAIGIGGIQMKDETHSSLAGKRR